MSFVVGLRRKEKYERGDEARREREGRCAFDAFYRELDRVL